jgi:exodeoxyribonuclease VII large subunit
VRKRLILLLNRIAAEQMQKLRRFAADLARIVKGRLSTARAEHERLSRRLVQVQPRAQVASRLTQLTVLRARLHRAIVHRVDVRPRVAMLRAQVDRASRHHLKGLRDHLNAAAKRLAAVDPSAVLNRGYSITMTKAGEVIRSANEVERNDLIKTRLRDGAVESVVTGGGRASRIRKRQGGLADQMDLFGRPR